MKPCCKEYLNVQFGGDEEIVAEIYNEYASSARDKTAEAAAALAAEQYDALDKIAHTIKGNALAAGDTEVADTAIELRKAAALSDAALSTPLIEKIRELAKGL